MPGKRRGQVKLPRVAWPSAVGRLDLIIMSAAFLIFGFSLTFQGHRWASTPAYHILLQIFTAAEWGALFLVSGTSMGLAAWAFGKRWAVIAALTLAFTLTGGWALAFAVRYLTSPSTTPETWVSWAVFGFLLLKVAISLDRPGVTPPGPEVTGFQQAIDEALSAAEVDQATLVAGALASGAGKRRNAVAAAASAYAEALREVVPRGAMPESPDLAQQAIDEAHNALLRAEDAYARATGQAVQPADPP